MTAAEQEKERKEIISAYRDLLKSANFKDLKKDKELVRKAFDLALDAHKDMRRKSGEPYIYHPIAVAKIVATEIGLGATSIACALLHDTVEDTEISLEDIEALFGPKVTMIIDGLTKISGIFDQSVSMQAENFRKMLLTLSEDVRVILIKIADRLHNMRTLDSMTKKNQHKIAYETAYLYAPLAHRLGLYNIKSELEDLSLKYTEPEAYHSIEQKLQKTKAVRTRFINRFSSPIKKALENSGLNFELKGRTKSVYSIWNKMQKQQVSFDEVYDIFAIRIITKSEPLNEKSDCWQVYSIVTDFYKPSPDRLRDWISTPKANGYESLHTTVMSPTGKWVEVQIRSSRMDEIAEKGFAAHWKYKEKSTESSLDIWINQIREMLENPDSNALDFVDDFKLNLFAEEIFIFTPKGELKTLPGGSTALDFAFEIHSQIGEKCIGAKVNHKLVPLSYKLKSGDQVEIITSKKQHPKEDWLQFVVSGKAKSKIKQYIKEERRIVAEKGKEILEKKFKTYRINFDPQNMQRVFAYFKLASEGELYYQVGKNSVDLNKLRNLKKDNGVLKSAVQSKKSPSHEEQLITHYRGNKGGLLVLGEEMGNIDYKLAPCCNPIPGDDVFGFITKTDGIKIHRITCPNAIDMMANFAYRIVQAKWTDQKNIAFLVGLKLTGFDHVGIVNDITKIISSELNVNMRSIRFDTEDGIFEGRIMAFVHDTQHLQNLIDKLTEINGINSVIRIDTDEISHR